jgi:hypothetical protein
MCFKRFLFLKAFFNMAVMAAAKRDTLAQKSQLPSTVSSQKKACTLSVLPASPE